MMPGDGDKPTKPLDDEPRPDVPSKPIPKPPPKPRRREMRIKGVTLALAAVLIFVGMSVAATVSAHAVAYRSCWSGGGVAGTTTWNTYVGGQESLKFVKNTGVVTEAWSWYRNGVRVTGGTLYAGQYRYLSGYSSGLNNTVWFAGNGYSCGVSI